MFDTDSGMEERDTQIEAIRTGLEGALARFAISAARRGTAERAVDGRAWRYVTTVVRACNSIAAGRSHSDYLGVLEEEQRQQQRGHKTPVSSITLDKYARHSLKYPHCASGGLLT